MRSKGPYHAIVLATSSGTTPASIAGLRDICSPPWILRDRALSFPSSASQETPSFGSSSSTSIPSESISEVAVHRPLITSWATAFRRRYPPSGSRSDLSETPAGEGTRSDSVESPVEATPIETTGKTRAQIKAAQYEKGCGEVWKTYQKCLKVTTSFGPPLRRADFGCRKPFWPIGACQLCSNRREMNIPRS